MSDENSDTVLVTEEPGKNKKSIEAAHDVCEEEVQPSLNPLPPAWISTGTSWLNSAKEKTMNTLDLVRKDLAELGDAMTQEVAGLTSAAKGGIGAATNVIKEQAQYLEKLVTPDEEEKSMVTNPQRNDNEPSFDSSVSSTQSNEESLAAKVEKSAAIGLGWMKSVVNSVTNTVKNLAIEETTEGEDDITEAIRPRIFRKTNLPPAKLLEIQSSEGTFRNEPENSEAYSKWMTRFNIEEYDAEINLLLGGNSLLRETYSKLVPSELDSKIFWSRYFFAIQIAEMDEELRTSFSLKELAVDTGAQGKISKKVPSLSVSPKQNYGGSPGSDESITVVDRQPTSTTASADDWSVCSEKNYVEEISSTNDDDEQAGPLTPRAKDDEVSKEDGDMKKNDNWVDWDE